MTRAAKLSLLLGFACVLAIVVGFLLFDAPMQYEMDCNRFSGRCTFTQRLMIRSKVGWAPIPSLERAEVRVFRGRQGGPRIQVWVKSTSGGGNHFFADYRSRGEADTAAQKIDAFLKDPSDGRLVLTRSVRTTYWLAWTLVPIVATLLVALAAIFFSKR